jgi:hypothetical protein
MSALSSAENITVGIPADSITPPQDAVTYQRKAFPDVGASRLGGSDLDDGANYFQAQGRLAAERLGRGD